MQRLKLQLDCTLPQSTVCVAICFANSVNFRYLDCLSAFDCTLPQSNAERQSKYRQLTILAKQIATHTALAKAEEKETNDWNDWRLRRPTDQPSKLQIRRPTVAQEQLNLLTELF